MRKKLWERSNDLHGHNKNEKTPGEKASFLQPAFFLVFPDAKHPVGGIKCRRARGRYSLLGVPPAR